MPRYVLLIFILATGLPACSNPAVQPATKDESGSSAPDQAKQAIQFGFRFYPEYWGSPPNTDGPLMKGNWTASNTDQCTADHVCRLVSYAVRSPTDGALIKCEWVYDLTANRVVRIGDQARKLFFQITPEAIQAETDAISTIRDGHVLRTSAGPEPSALQNGQWMAFPSDSFVRGEHVYHIYYVIDLDRNQSVWCHWILNQDTGSVTPDQNARDYFEAEGPSGER